MGAHQILVRATLIMFREFNTLELTFCVEFVIIYYEIHSLTHSLTLMTLMTLDSNDSNDSSLVIHPTPSTVTLVTLVPHSNDSNDSKDSNDLS